MRQRRPTNYELRLERLQEEDAPDGENRRGILEIFDRVKDEHGQRPDEDAPLHRDPDD
jgi:hypothetical protein